MFGTANVVAQSMPVYGAFNPWWVLIWLALMAGCLVLAAGVVLLVNWVTAVSRRRSHVQRRVHVASPIDGMSNP